MLDTLYEKQELSLRGVTDWFEANKLKLNSGKTQKLHFTLKRGERHNIKLLVVQISSDLSWARHIDELCGKLRSVAFKVKRIKDLVNTKTAHQVDYVSG